MVLCVSTVRVWGGAPPPTPGSGGGGSVGAGDASGTPAEVELTDGWYWVRAVLDGPLSALLRRGWFGEGSKLLIVHAELAGDAQPAPPLEACKRACLKVHYNGCRRARWDAKLGFCAAAAHPSSGFHAPLAAVHASGGLVPCLTLMVTRVYPLLFRAEGGGGGGGGGGGVAVRAPLLPAAAEDRAMQAFVRRRTEVSVFV